MVGSTTYTERSLELTAKVQDIGLLLTIEDDLQVVEEMIRMKCMTKEEYLKAMPILPTSDEKTADEATKFSSELEKLSTELSNNEMSPEVIGEFLTVLCSS